MKKRGIQVLSVLLSALMVFQSPGVSGLFHGDSGTAYAYTERQATVNATTLNVRSGPGTTNAIVKKLYHGTSVKVVGEERDGSGTVWYKIRFTSGSQTQEGYASSTYIKFPSAVTYTQDANFENYLNQQGFPESYKDSLRTLHAEHPTWVFQAQKTGLDWNDVMANEGAVGANLVGSASMSSWKSTEYGAYDWNTGVWTGFDGASWVAASREIVSYYMDPRNFLNDTYIFQFLNHSYDSAHQTREGVASLVSGTFLAGGTSAGGSTGGSASSGGSSSGNTGGSGPSSSGGASASQGGPSAGQMSGPSAGQTSGPSSQSPAGGNQSQTPGGVQVTTPGGGSGNVSLEGPSIASSVRELPILAMPSVQYGPGMDASSITGDNTGASTTSPVPEGASYTDIIMNAASQSGVNPYVLAAMILQEQGKGTSGSISGKTSGYEGYYNFFNVGAYQAGNMSAVTRGLWYASQNGNYGRPWNSIAKSIVGGSLYYGDNYVKQGQDTFYLKKYNVQGSNLYKHQYMTNVEGAAGEGAKLARAYTDEMKNQTLVFKIPVYNNMPETACARPSGDGSPNNKLSSLEVTGYALTPTFNRDTESYDIIVNPSVERIAVNASALDSKASISGAGTISLQSGNNTISVDVRAENGTIRTYKLNVVRQSNAPSVQVPAGTNSGPSSTGSVGSAGMTSGPGGAPVPPSTTAAQPSTAAPSATTAARPSTGNSDVQVGVGPGGSLPTEAPAPTAAAPAPPATEAPAPPATEAPTQAAPPETTAAQPAANLKPGDCNGDGSVTILDLILIKKQILGQNVLSEAGKKAADLNGDGSITSKDATALQNKLLN